MGVESILAKLERQKEDSSSPKFARMPPEETHLEKKERLTSKLFPAVPRAANRLAYGIDYRRCTSGVIWTQYLSARDP